MDLPQLDGLAGLASLVTSVLMVPTIMSLKKLAASHSAQLQDNNARLAKLEKPRKKRRGTI